MTKTSCPISTELVNSNLTRTYSFVTLIAISFYVFTPYKEIIFISAIDFIIRIFFGLKYSPICNIIKYILKIGNFQAHMVNAGPKKFAAKIGLIITVLMSMSFLMGLTYTSAILGTISLTAVGAEAIFGFCIACWMYSKMPRFFK
jgi:hypothetical protein